MPLVVAVVVMGMRVNRNILWIFVIGLLLSSQLGGPADAQGSLPANATLVVRVEKVAPEGIVRLGLYTEALYPDDNATPVASADVPAMGGETVVTLQNVPVGTYAIEVYQDLNSNGKMDLNLLGLPKEPYGFSRDARPLLSRPNFSRVKFDVAAGQNSQSVILQNTKPAVRNSISR